MSKRLVYRVLFMVQVLSLSNLTINYMPAQPVQSDIIFDFNTTNTSGQWVPVNDGVMGGISRSTFDVLPEGIGEFKGSVSLENNGGFASVRTPIDANQLKGYDGIRLRVRGDGKTYSLRLRTDRRLDGISFRATFDTKKDEWIELAFPFDTFVPGFRGRTMRNVDPLQPATIRQLGVLISDKQTGSFVLHIDWIEAYKNND